MDLCLVAAKTLGSRVANWWKERVIWDLEGMKAAAREVEHIEGEENTEMTETN